MKHFDLSVRTWALIDFHILLLFKILDLAPPLSWKIVIGAGVINATLRGGAWLLGLDEQTTEADVKKAS